MRKLIGTRPEAGTAGFGSSFDPVLAGVAQGLARLFPPVENTRPPHRKAGGEPPASARAGETAGGGPRG